MNKMIIFSIAIVLLIVIAGGGYWYATQTKETSIACTAEMRVKLCPDGSAVGRTGPHCEFAACPNTEPATSTVTSTIVQYDSGIRGTVVLGPTCPVERDPPDPNCADRPYKTLVTIFRVSDPTHAFLSINSSASGTFLASLPPGEYTIGAGEINLPRCDHPQVTVGLHTFTSTTISCDTGIR